MCNVLRLATCIINGSTICKQTLQFPVVSDGSDFTPAAGTGMLDADKILSKH